MRNRFNFSGFPDLTRPQWAGREINPNDLLPGGAKLDDASFTAYTASVIVTLTALANAGAVSLSVAALSAGIPAGTVLNFGVAKQAYVTQAAAAAAVALVISPLVTPLASGDVGKFTGQYGKLVPAGTFVSRTFAQRNAGVGFHPAVAVNITNTAGAAALATAITVAALPFALPAGYQFVLGGVVVVLTAAAAAGATSIAVQALPAAIAINSIAGVVEDEMFLIAYEVKDLDLDNDVALLIPFRGFPVKENFLPNIAGITAAATVLAALRARYACTIGAE